jgi:Phosphatidylserine/phosphatidylglycerophosphate/cardiolipin synthases and related enzymes
MDGRRIGEREPTPLFRELLANPEIEIRFKRSGSPLMHLKSYQIDGRWLRTGAANFSASGLKRQDNDLLVIDSQAAAELFKRRFEAIFAQGRTPALAATEQNPYRAEPNSASLENPDGHRWSRAVSPARRGNSRPNV